MKDMIPTSWKKTSKKEGSCDKEEGFVSFRNQK